MYKHNNIKSILNFFGLLILNLIVINAVLFNNFYNINKLQIDNTKEVINKTIIEFDEIDLQHLCIVSNCTRIGFLNSDYNYKLSNKKKYYKAVDKSSHTLIRIKNKPLIKYTFFDIYLSESLLFYTEIKDYNIYVVSNNNIISNILKGYISVNLLFFFIFLIVFIFIEFKSRKKKIIELMGTSNILREKNMQILTENIHHELNTPIAIIHGNLKKLEIEMQKPTINDNFFFDFEQIYLNINQMDTVLQRMSNFKNLKYSNGNKTLDDIISYSANSMAIYKKSNFTISLDPALKKYKLRGTLENGDLLSIVSNHFRNSLEAKANKIKTQINFDKSTNILHLYIIDNGIGLRDRRTGLMLSKSKYNDIFKPYYSSKDKDGDSKELESKGIVYDTFCKIYSFFKIQSKDINVRGVGLYLNKELLREKHGDLILRETSNKGTVFEIIFQVQEVQEVQEIQEGNI